MIAPRASSLTPRVWSPLPDAPLGGPASYCLVEAERSVLFSMGFRAHDTYYRILARTPLILAPTVSKPQLENLRGLINAKDAHVVAATIALEAPFLLTLDKSLEAEVNRLTLPTRAFLPGDFIKQILPTHKEYPIQDPAAWDAWR